MDISPIFACGPNEGMMYFIYAVYGGVGSGVISLLSGVAGGICMLKGKKRGGGWLISFAVLFAMVTAGAFLCLRSL